MCRPAIRRRPPALLVAWLALLLGGCAHVRVDEHGSRHVLGLVALTLPVAGCAAPGADALRLRSVGLSLTSAPAGSALVLGWHDSTLYVLRNDALVTLPAGGR